MSEALALLGLKDDASEEEIRSAYRRLARRWHPDQFQDDQKREDAPRHMVALNHAYEEALAAAARRRPKSAAAQALSCADAVKISHILLEKGYPESALQQLFRATSRSADWYAAQGKVLMEMSQFQSAEQSYREAVRMDPNNITYRAGALDALVAFRNSRTLAGRLRHWMHKDKR